MMTQPYYVTKDIQIVDMMAHRDQYRNYPSCQREFVWKLSMQQRLIDTILRGLPIPSLLAIEEEDVFGTRMEIIDGQQRLETIIRFLSQDPKIYFATATRSDEPRVPPVEPGKKYHELSPKARQALDSYTLRFSILKNVNDYDIGQIFRRLQYSEKLNFAEILYSYDSETGKVADIVQRHSFFEDIWVRSVRRKERFMMGLLILLLESSDGPCNLTTDRLKAIAAGTRTKDAGLNTTDVSTSINRRLTGLSHVFNGITIHQTTEIIPLYEAGMLLENAGFDLFRSRESCLTGWFMKIKELFLENRRLSLSNANSFVKLTQKYKQIEFWKDHLDSLVTSDGLFRKDAKRAFDLLDKVKLWNAQGGICPKCHASVRVDDIGHHEQQHSEGGPTTISNGALIHAECHKQVHRQSVKNMPATKQHELSLG